MLRLPIIGLFGLLPALLAAAEPDGHYLARQDGQPAEKLLRSQGQHVEGEYVERNNLRLNISGRFDGQSLTAQISEPGSGLLIANMNANYANGMLNVRIAARSPRSGEVLEREALFHRQTHSPQTAAAEAQKQPRDPALVGTWVHEQQINSGAASFAAMSTQMILQLSADGRVSQWTRSVAGGADWHHDSPGELQYSGRWQNVDGLLMVQLQGHSDYQPAARYHFSEQYLVTDSNTGKLIWQKR
jgi:hypothetical protein